MPQQNAFAGPSHFVSYLDESGGDVHGRNPGMGILFLIQTSFHFPYRPI